MNRDIFLEISNKSLPGFPGKGSGPVINWQWKKGENWVILGNNGSGKTYFSQLIASSVKGRSEEVSFEDMQDLMEDEIRRDDSEYSGKVDTAPLCTVFWVSRTKHTVLPEGRPCPEGWRRCFPRG